MALGFDGDGDHEQRWDYVAPTYEPRIVWRRSVPHNLVMPDFTAMTASLGASGYTVTALVTTRDWAASVLSQVAIRHTKTEEESWLNLRAAHLHVAEWLRDTKVPFYLVHYESLLKSPESVMGMIAGALCVPPCALPERITDENAKWLR